MATIARSKRVPRTYHELLKLESNLPPLLSRPIMAVTAATTSACASRMGQQGVLISPTVPTEGGGEEGQSALSGGVSHGGGDGGGGDEGNGGGCMHGGGTVRVSAELAEWAPQPDVLLPVEGGSREDTSDEVFVSYADSFLAAIAVAADVPAREEEAPTG